MGNLFRLLMRKCSFLVCLVVFGVFFVPKPFFAESSRIKIVTTVFPLMEFSKGVCGERGKVILLLPPGAEVHTWNPRPSDIIKIASADLFVYIGASLEPWVDDILMSVKNPHMRVLEASSGLRLLEKKTGSIQSENPHRRFDPHIWLDFEWDQSIIDKIACILAEIDPENSLLYQRRAFSYKEKLQSLHRKFQNGLRYCLHRVFVVGGHSAFGYLARKYNLHQISLYGLSPDSKPTPRQMVEVVRLARRHKIKTVYFESFVSDELARVIAREVGARTLVLNPGANLTEDQLESGISFFDIMEKNLENLRNGLECR